MLISAVLAAAWPATATAASDPGLGAAEYFAVLAASTVTNTGPTSVAGALGLAPGSAVTGFPPGVSGSQHRSDPAAFAAQASLAGAYATAAAQPCSGGSNLTGVNLGGQTLGPGVYCQSTAPTLSGTLVLNGSWVYIFQIGSTLITASGANVVLTGGAQPCQIFWQVGSSATIATSTNFVGTIMAMASITMQTGATLQGRALARTAAVTLDSNHIYQPGGCSYPAPSVPPPPAALPVAPLPAPPVAINVPVMPGQPSTPAAPGDPVTPLDQHPANAAPADPDPSSTVLGLGPSTAGDYPADRAPPGRQRLPTAADSATPTCQGPDCGPSLCPALVPAPLESGCVAASRLSALIGLAATGQPVIALLAGLMMFATGVLLVRRRRVIERPSD